MGAGSECRVAIHALRPEPIVRQLQGTEGGQLRVDVHESLNQTWLLQEIFEELFFVNAL